MKESISIHRTASYLDPLLCVFGDAKVTRSVLQLSAAERLMEMGLYVGKSL